MEIKILHRVTKGIIFSGDYPSIKDAVEDAVSRGVSLAWADLSMADLYKADLYKANLYKANLSGADLSYANLYKANLSKADLYKANLSGANLSGANLSYADLSKADLSKANLSYADLSSAIFKDTIFYGELLNSPPKQILGGKYPILITKKYIKIGCSLKTIEEWKSLKKKDFLEEFSEEDYLLWKSHKRYILLSHSHFYNQ